MSAAHGDGGTGRGSGADTWPTGTPGPGSSKNSVRVQNATVETVSYPERTAKLFLIGTGVFVVAVNVLVLFGAGVLQGESDFGAVWGTAVAVGAVLAVLLWAWRAARVRMRADENGIHLHTLTWARTSIPWHAVGQIRAERTGSGLQLGWRMLGGGLIGYLAGTEGVHVAIRPEAGQDAAARGGRGSRRLASAYLISVPQSEQVAQKLAELRRCLPLQGAPDER